MLGIQILVTKEQYDNCTLVIDGSVVTVRSQQVDGFPVPLLFPALLYQMQLECGPMPNVMAAQPNVGGPLCKSCVFPFLVPCRKVWMTPAAGVLCSNAASVGNARLGRKVNFAPGKVPSGGKSRPRKCIYSVAAQETAKHRVKFGWLPLSCSNEVKMRKPLTLARVLQTIGPISAASGPNFTIF